MNTRYLVFSLLGLTIALTLCGCMPLQMYAGEERPKDSVAIIYEHNVFTLELPIVERYAKIISVDGTDIADKYSNSDISVAVLPGSHTLKCRYYESRSDKTVYSQPQAIVVTVVAGKTYILRGNASRHWLEEATQPPW